MSLFAKELKIRITFEEDALGTSPKNEQLLTDYIAAKAPDAKTREQEIETLGAEEVTEKAMTGFPKNAAGEPFYWDYQIKGFFKDSMGFLRQAGKAGTAAAKACGKVTNYKKKVDGLIFPMPRQIPIKLNGLRMGTCERPLRAETMQGPRVAIAKSETCPAGSTIEFTIGLLDASLEPAARECLDYGVLHGLGQWRNSGAGRFAWEEIK